MVLCAQVRAAPSGRAEDGACADARPAGGAEHGGDRCGGTGQAALEPDQMFL